jgi:hypothetical protein
MIISPVRIEVDNGITYNGVLLEAEDLKNVVSLIDRSNANGLKGVDVCLLMRLKDAYKTLSENLAK